MESLCVKAGINNGLISPFNGPKPNNNNGPNQYPTVVIPPTAAADSSSSKFSSFNINNFKYPLKSLFSGGMTRNDNKGVSLNDALLVDEVEKKEEGQNGNNWLFKILHFRKKCDQGQNGHFNQVSDAMSSSLCDCEGFGVVNGDESVDKFDRESFSKLLKKVSLSQSKLYAKFSVLGELAYDIPSIKPENLLKRHSLHYVTSSIEKREQLAEAEKKEKLAKAEAECEVEITPGDDQKNDVRKSTAYQIAVSAASYLHSRAQALLPARSSKDEEDHKTSKADEISINSEMASLMATTDSVTAVVAAKEEVKQAVAEDLSSISSSPCEWFVCDDEKSSTRFFVIQGSETLASWQANLLFEPMQFEGLNVFVHRGIYEAAKGIYQQMLPEVHAYMKTHGNRAKFRFTGHSLGGSLSMLINLMLLIREEVPYSSLLPVITFGSPCVMCGGDDLLRKLGLPKSHVQAIVMHRDIVPRAFSCNYPRPAAQLLKALNKSFRNYPCLDTQKQLYAPMGEMLILQPDSKISPQHDLLPSGSGLYLLTFNMDDSTKTENQLRAAKNAFLNRPHPLQILTDRSSYGKGGAIRRDHDMNSYLKCMRTVIRQELSRVRRAERELRRKSWLWPLIKPRVIETGIVLGPPLAHNNGISAQLNFAGAFNSGRESLKRLSRLVASQHMHLILVFLFPARLLIIGAYSIFPR